MSRLAPLHGRVSGPLECFQHRGNTSLPENTVESNRWSECSSPLFLFDHPFSLAHCRPTSSLFFAFSVRRGENVNTLSTIYS